MSKSLGEQVGDRARGCCEYCQMPQQLDVQPFQLDHIRAKKHGGDSSSFPLELGPVTYVGDRMKTIETRGIVVEYWRCVGKPATARCRLLQIEIRQTDASDAEFASAHVLSSRPRGRREAEAV